MENIEVEFICNSLDCTLDQLRQRDRNRDIAFKRKVFYLANEMLGMSHGTIASYIDRDRSTVLMGLQRLRSKEKEMAKQVVESYKEYKLGKIKKAEKAVVYKMIRVPDYKHSCIVTRKVPA